MAFRRWWFGFALAAAVAGASTQGCSCDAELRVSGGAGGKGTGGEGASLSVGEGGSGAGSVECTPPCSADEVCSHGACVPLVPCTNDNECINDTYCDPDKGCLPWDGKKPAHDEACINAITPGILSPTVKCEFSAAPQGDPFPNHVDVQGTPIVVNFNKPASAGPPSIAASFTATVVGGYTEDQGVIRVLRGKDCALETNLGGTDLDGDGVVDYTVSSASLATADLDGDGVAEIVAYGADGSTLAFTKKNGAWSLLWKSAYVIGIPGGPCDPSSHGCPLGWAGPSIHDLDDDGVPEIIREGAVIGADGAVKSLAPTGYASYSAGLFSVIANLDQDPLVEITNGEHVWEWQANVGWVQEVYFPGASAAAPGHVAIADFGAYGQGVPANNPEIAVVRSSQVMVYAITGELA